MSSSTSAEILPTHTARLFDEAVRRAVEKLRSGGVVALPTETVYGLAANALDSNAVQRIFEIKGRPSHNPIIVHVAGVELAKRCVRLWPKIAEELARAFWPGPLTLVLERAANIPDVVTAGGKTVGVRWPSHPFIQAVIRACDFPLAAPSANLSNELSPTNAEHVRRSLGNRIELIIDGGQSQVGIESTVVDVSIAPARVLRPGMIHQESLLAVTGQLGEQTNSAGILKSPGQLPRHYSPKAKLWIFAWENESDLRRRARELPTSARIHVIAHTHIPSADGFDRVSLIPHDAEAFARAIYAELHHCDQLGADCIIVEAVPTTNEWSAIADRLKRAATY